MLLIIKNIFFFIILTGLVTLLIIILFFKPDISNNYIYFIGASIVTVLGILLWDFINKKNILKPKQLLDLPNSKLDDNPKIVFNESLELLMSQLKIIQPFFKHAIYLIDPESNNFTLHEEKVEYFAQSINIQNNIFHKIFSEEQTLIVKPNEAREDWTEIILEQETLNSNCLLGAKIIYNKTPIGTLFALVDDARRIESNDQILIKQFAKQISLSLYIIDKIESLQKHNIILDRINSLVKSVNISNNKSVIYEQIVEICQSIFKYDKLTIMVTYQDSDHARIEYIDGYTLDISREEVFSLKKSIFSKVIKNRQIINSIDINKDFGKHHRFFEEEMTKRNITSVLAVPLMIGDTVDGCISIERFEEKGYSEMHQLYLEKITQSLNILLRWQSEYHKMYLNTTLDNLTGLMNYRAFLNMLDIEMNRALRNDQSLVIMVIDVDKFKRINDNFGHPTGNIALREIAQLIASSIRNIDILARYGGEEFIIAVNNSDINNVTQIAERIVSNVGNNIFIFNEQRVKITVSVGMAEYPKDTDQVQKLIEAADRAMYNAKNNGGNTFSV